MFANTKENQHLGMLAVKSLLLTEVCDCLSNISSVGVPNGLNWFFKKVHVPVDRMVDSQKAQTNTKTYKFKKLENKKCFEMKVISL